ncbi:AGK_G0006490.mRNA.1.CDS.1 [Saccharomyces cerevisiae]|nr:AGK_G0006490.mRNA.1.CDS.1 [Saccharomyces cerevisiae]CAI5241351.1 BBF_HP2_G0006390.mRNA.1.CDS.1 [Saccharomyces cerevisiae]CAI6414948.1 BBF_HP1_G0006360.mRNA.1.CDS.1 [Saccharomyces cerevisiae]CAI6415078.1 BBF_HP2_G0006390.mRNA.1.CDS.1 [Saccharomyces cerevisiae]CAI6527009.1 AGK_G0006490.mRNA.1.CDS.1 [Saccharomyces cerevisiae]
MNLPSITLLSTRYPVSFNHTTPNHDPPLYLPPTHSPSTITVTLQLPISNSTATYPTIHHVPLTILLFTHHIETLTNDRK